ncbi:MAG TPA: RidA family protein [Longimicrobiales bacterium]|nr:RidA family protein [Longimicrobiales bacterium]
MKGSKNWTPIQLDEEFPPPVGAYSPAVRAGNLVFVSGQVPKDPRTGAIVGEDVGEQTRQALENAERALTAAGATLGDVVSVTAYLSNMEHWGDFDAVYREILRPPYPTRTTVGVDLHGFLVELSLIAVAR